MHRGPKLASPANKSVTKDVAGEEPMKAGQFIAVSLCAVAAATSAQARITRISITKVESPAFDGRAFGGVGQYEKLVGRATGEVDPSDPRNAIITDIALAPRNANGKVAYETDVMIFRPIDRSKGNRKTWYELTNRGAILAFTQINDGPNGNNPTKAADAGNGFLMAQGYTILLSGWDSSAPATQNRFTTKTPVAVNRDGSPVVGPAMEEIVVDDNKTVQGSLSYPSATLDKSQATLTVRVRYDDPPTVIPADRWDYANEAGTAIKLVDGAAFQQGTLYEFVYQAKNPVVAGLGLAAVRDLASFAKFAEKDDAGTANPLQGDATFLYTACVSQPCRTMHDVLLLGFNTDESGRKVVDGVVNWIGGATGVFLNYRFAQPFRTHRQHIGRWYPEFQGPFTNQVMLDSVTGRTDGRLRRCPANGYLPEDLRDQFGERVLGQEHGVASCRCGRQGHRTSRTMCAAICWPACRMAEARRQAAPASASSTATRWSATPCCGPFSSRWTNG